MVLKTSDYLFAKTVGWAQGIADSIDFPEEQLHKVRLVSVEGPSIPPPPTPRTCHS